MESRIVEVELPNGEVALFRAGDLEGGGATKTAFGRLRFDTVSKALEGIAESVKAAVDKAAPTKFTVELGLQLVVKSGELLALFADAETTGSLTVTLEWERDGRSTAAGG